MYEIKNEDDFEDFSNHAEMFDFSNYSAKSKYYDNSNKLVVGKMKDFFFFSIWVFFHMTFTIHRTGREGVGHF